MFEREPSILISCRAVRCLILINVLKTPCCTSSFWSLDVVDEFATRSASILSWKIRVLSKLLLRFLQEMSVRKKMMKARKTLILSSSYKDIILGDPNCWSFFSEFFGGSPRRTNGLGACTTRRGVGGSQRNAPTAWKEITLQTCPRQYLPQRVLEVTHQTWNCSILFVENRVFVQMISGPNSLHYSGQNR